MKQHPIPQNILDIEFKLFTKFTVREFVYMAVGIGFGGIFLYFFTTGALPAIIAFPIFIGSSAVGLFLGLVPINDQQADMFLRNYIVAITNPTQRVWRNKADETAATKEAIKNQMEVTTGTMQRGQSEAGSAKIVGADSLSTSQFVQNPITQQLDKEEEQRLAAIDVHTIPGMEASIVPPSPAPQSKSVEITSASTPVSVSKGEEKILISRDNLPNLQTTENTNIPMGIALTNKENRPIGSAIVAVKDDNGKILFAQRTDNNGNVPINRLLPTGRYSIIVQTQQKLYNHIQLLSDGKPFPTVKILLNE